MANRKQTNRKRKMSLKASAFAMAFLLAISQMGMVAFAEDDVSGSVAAETTEAENNSVNEEPTPETSETVTETEPTTGGEIEPTSENMSGEGEAADGEETPVVEPEQNSEETPEEKAEENSDDATAGVIDKVNKELVEAIEGELTEEEPDKKASEFENLTVEDLQKLAAVGQFTEDDLEELLEAGNLSEEEIASLRAVIEAYILEQQIEEEEELESFEMTRSCNGVLVTLQAPEGVFPAGSYFEVKEVSNYEEENIKEALEVVREDTEQVKTSYTYDITVYDKYGNEIEPDTSYGKVKVTFAFEEATDKNLEAKVYHIEGEGDDLSVEELESSVNGDEVITVTDSFSYYTVEFTYGGELRYVLDGDSKVALSEILKACDLDDKGEVSAVKTSDEKLFKAVYEGEQWYIKAVKAFSTEEWMKVTIGGDEYTIIVTDDQTPHVHDGITFDPWTEETSLPATEGNYYLTKDVTLSSAWYPSGTVNLCLNGHVIQQTGTAHVAIVQINNTLNLYDCDTSTTHEGYVDNSGLWHLGTGDGTVKNITGGVLTGGKSGGSNNGRYGGGVNVTSGTFNMYGGTIAGNQASANGGGGVFVSFQTNYYGTNGIFNMYGGSICYNTAISDCDGGGVYLSDATFTMTSGSITNNKAAGCGGGILVFNYASVNLTAAEGKEIVISDNQAAFSGGVHARKQFTLSGKVIIKDNTCTDADGAKNLGLRDVSAMITGALTGSDIYASYINTSDNKHKTGVLTKYFKNFNSEAKLGDFFTYDGSAQYDMILNTSGELQVKNTYAITNAVPQEDAGVNHGYLVIPKEKAADGATVTVTVTPNSGYRLKEDSLKYYLTEYPDEKYSLTQGQNNTYTFTMPSYAVTLTTEFELDPNAGPGTFTDLNTLISQASAGETITLTNDYTFDEATDSGLFQIQLDKDIVIVLNGHTIDRSPAQTQGRVFMVANGVTASIKNGTIKGAKLEKGQGGAIVTGMNANLTLNKVNFIENSALQDQYGSYDAGAVSCSYGSTLTATDCTFKDNYARRHGGAISLSGVNATLINCTFEGNISGVNGGAIFVTSGTKIKTTGCTFKNNAAEYPQGISGDGGAIYILGDDANKNDCSFENCAFEGNRAENGGAVHVWNGSNCELKNCQFSNNSAKNSSAINNIQADLILDNVTITKNVTKGGQGAVTISANGNMKATATFKNTVNIFDNTNSDSTKCEPGLEFSSPKSLLNVSALSKDSKIAVSRYSDYPVVSEWVFSGDIPAGVGTKNVYSTSKEGTVIIKDNKFVWQVNGKPDEPTKPSGGHSEKSHSYPPVQPVKIVTETGLILNHYVATGRAGVMNEVPLPYISSDVKYNGWNTINEVLLAYKGTTDAKTKPLSITMNGFATVDNNLLKSANEQKVDLAFNLDNAVTVVMPKQNDIIAKQLNAAGADTSKVFLKVSALTQINTAELAKKTTGLNFADVQAIGGTANTPVVKILTSNKENSLKKDKIIEIEFDTNIITDDAGNKIYKPGQNIYLYNGSDVAGVAYYKSGKVGKDGKVRFTVPMVTSLWTVGPKNMGKTLFKL